ncbi:hypothetical protein TVAG_056210 [Trichomonas vaginalis G3]|uniref:Uncharacterized protein n=1 Tax=Trichomonas vaginalis (strain ATCC PRA-98 / G3) TaxID=412133 RepID=A2EL74_TRIV3|nr:hypothetical protein TVAGG3_0217620 [Trichomonas vaginalis G3]EAY06627.1 hypothetical protein TVAG_056210 [Trichomonas vaginalis G3]KAI5551675.1 hypothetical protein TVAGG3_0217620 [Trichomonas vaginalis G3]|eukprot:XP_001318850.1 hypothetical protein [Trichomonas vaginalis G3]
MSLYPSYGLPTLIKIPEASIKQSLPSLQLPPIDLIDFEMRILPSCKFVELYEDEEDSDYPEAEEMIDLNYKFNSGPQIDFIEVPLVNTEFDTYLDSKTTLNLEEIEEEQYELLDEPVITFNPLKLRVCSKFVEYPIDFDFIIPCNSPHKDITPSTIVLGDFTDTPPSEYNINLNLTKKEVKSIPKVSNKTSIMKPAPISSKVSKANPNLKITYYETVEDVIRDKESTEKSSFLSKGIISKEVKKKKVDSKLFPDISIKNEQNNKEIKSEMTSEEINNQLISLKLSKEVRNTPKIVEQSVSDKNQSSDDNLLSNLHFSSDSDQNQTETNDESNSLHLFDTNHILQGKVVKNKSILSEKKQTFLENVKNEENSDKIFITDSSQENSDKKETEINKTVKNVDKNDSLRDNSVINMSENKKIVKNSEETLKNDSLHENSVKNESEDGKIVNIDILRKKSDEVIQNDGLLENSEESVKNQNLHDKNLDKTRKCFIADSSFSNNEMFTEVFDDCRVIYRKLSDHQFELNTKECVIMNDMNLKNVSNCLSVFDNVYLISVGNCIDYQPFIGVGRVFVRRVSSQKEAFLIIKSMSKPLEFDRIEETLHEYFLSLFPCVPRIVAMSWLMKGNPVSDPNCIPKYDVCSHMFQVVLDSKTFLQSKPRTKNPLVKRIEAYATNKTKISKN